ncbi:hypothetical protein [Dysgonomonas sp. 520]|uniref:hypothetical protein n=1 Tax=Dysgonomonas sp. 520 TaxID=2302931 RepID=UPI0013D1487F|nr:hypothetical protein [Dysgonomonas sp. 520]NDW10422.1 hypothetical protein [Dysgonomonas sp. 520]
MPEMLYNQLEIIGDDNQVKEVREFLKGKPSKREPNMFIDFNKIIPSPDESVQCVDWSYENWQTKWNAFSQKSPKPNQIIFITINDPVPFLINELSCKFPYVMFLYIYYLPDDEVHLFIKNGIETEIPRECFFFDD